jgi:hypothetical protein
MVVEEGDEVLFAALKNAREFANVSQTFDDLRNRKEQRIVKGRIDTEPGLIRAVSPYKPVDCLLIVVNFAERKKVSLPQCLGKFPNRIAESFKRKGLNMFRCVDPETIKIEYDQVLIGLNQNTQPRLAPYLAFDGRLAARGRVVFNDQLPLPNKITLTKPSAMAYNLAFPDAGKCLSRKSTG